MNIAYTKGHKTKETNYAKTITKHKAKEHEFWRLHHIYKTKGSCQWVHPALLHLGTLLFGILFYSFQYFKLEGTSAY